MWLNKHAGRSEDEGSLFSVTSVTPICDNVITKQRDFLKGDVTIESDLFLLDIEQLSKGIRVSSGFALLRYVIGSKSGANVIQSKVKPNRNVGVLIGSLGCLCSM